VRRLEGGRLWVLLATLLVVGIALSLALGPIRDPSGWVITRLRLPRVALAMLAGSSLAVSGCVLQALLRNELADPYTLGISAGAGLSAGTLILMQASLPAAAYLLAGSAGAVLAAAAVWALSRIGGGGDPRILLAGVTVNLVGASLLLLVEFFGPVSRLVEIVRWMMGDLSAVDATVPLYLLPFAVAGMVLVAFRTGTLNQLAMGDDLAATRGVSVGRERNTLLAAASILAGGVVGAVGPIGFVGLMVPHAMRRMAGSDYRTLVPASAVGGMILLLFADVLSRVVVSPAEIPIGIVMALSGGPFFMFLLLRDRSARA
jgi:iron complex transport system permease protein